jgi:hypothetical protein
MLSLTASPHLVLCAALVLLVLEAQSALTVTMHTADSHVPHHLLVAHASLSKLCMLFTALLCTQGGAGGVSNGNWGGGGGGGRVAITSNNSGAAAFR